MQRLKKVWNYWMELDIEKWIDYIPVKILIPLVWVASCVFTIGLFWCSYACFDLRYPMYGKNHYEMPLWERIVTGCLSAVGGSVLFVRTVSGIWNDPENPFPENGAMKLFKRDKNPFRPTNRRNKQ